MLSTALELLGLTAITVGAFMLAPFAGFIVGGIALIWIGLSSEGDDA